MIHITVMGLSPKDKKKIAGLKEALINEALHAPNNEHPEEEIYCHVPAEDTNPGEITVLVEGLYYNPDRKQRSKKETAREMVKIVSTFFPPETPIKCLVGPFNNLPGFYEKKIKKQK